MLESARAIEAKHDPHAILAEIAEIDSLIEERMGYRKKLDSLIEERMDYRKKLVSMYEELMNGYRDHARQVLNRQSPQVDYEEPREMDVPKVRSGWD